MEAYDLAVAAGFDSAVAAGAAAVVVAVAVDVAAVFFRLRTMYQAMTRPPKSM